VREQDRITQQLHLLHQTNRQLRDKNEGAPRSPGGQPGQRCAPSPAAAAGLVPPAPAEPPGRICPANLRPELHRTAGRRMDSCDLDSDNPDSGMSTLRDVPDLEVEDAANNWAAAAAAAAGISAPPPRSVRSSGYYSRQRQQQRFGSRKSNRQALPPAAAAALNSESEAGEDAARGGAVQAERVRQSFSLSSSSSSSRIRCHRSDAPSAARRGRAAGLDCRATPAPELTWGVSTDSLQRSQECLSGHSAITNVPRRDRRGGGGAGSRRQKPESSPGRQAAAGQEASTSCAIVTVSGNPERACSKWCWAGDAAVGKSSFIMRLCDNRFTENTTATLGWTSRLRLSPLMGRVFAHCRWVHIIKVYTFQLNHHPAVRHGRPGALPVRCQVLLRRADGVLLLFDCTYERSFLSVREWVDQVHEAADKSVPIMICSNKTDFETGAQQTGQSGWRKEYDALFAECQREERRECADVNRANVRLGKDDDKRKECKRKIGLLRFLDSDLGPIDRLIAWFTRGEYMKSLPAAVLSRNSLFSPSSPCRC
uniref:Ras-related protein Rab-26 n=1 Tax=Macrostomum lignano TaxID=282301 RepID=A0A1I8F7U4_9PLAT